MATDERNARLYAEQSRLLEDVRKGDVQSMHRVLDYVIDGNDVISGMAHDIILNIEMHSRSSGFDLHYAGKVLERILTSPSAARVSPSGDPEVMRPVWNPALRANDAQYALRVLTESDEFGRAGYSKEKVMGLARAYNEEVAARGARIGAELMIAKGGRDYIFDLNTGDITIVPLPETRPEALAAARTRVA